MIKKTILLIIFTLLAYILTGCSKPVEPDTPTNAAIALKEAIRSGNYEYFNSLFSEGRKNSLSKDEYLKLQKLLSSDSSLDTYEVITFDNGKMLLVHLTPEKENDNYHIQDIKVVPEEMKALFQKK